MGFKDFRGNEVDAAGASDALINRNLQSGRWVRTDEPTTTPKKKTATRKTTRKKTTKK